MHYRYRILQTCPFVTLLLILIFGISGTSLSTTAAGTAIAFVDVNVVPMDSEYILSNQTVIIEGDFIHTIGPVDEVEIPSGATVINGQGRYLMPGLYDLHVHVEKEEELTFYIANGVTTIFNMKGRQWHLDLRERLLRGEVLGPRLFSCGPYIRNIEDVDEARAKVVETVDSGYDCVKLKNNWSRPAYEALVDEAIARNIMIYGHAPRNLHFDVVLEKGQQRIAHLEELVYTTVLNDYVDQFRSWGNRPLPNEDPAANVASTVEKLARAVAQAGVWVVPTEVVIDMYRRRTTDAFNELLERPYLRYLDPVALRRWKRGSLQGRGRAARFQQQFLLQQSMLRAFKEAGVKLALGTDSESGDLMVMHGWAVHQELALLVDAGYTPYEALRTATVAAAEFLGRGDREGTLRIGSRADIVVVRDNPLADISNASHIDGVVISGRWLPREVLDQRLDKILATYAPLEEGISELELALEQGGVAVAVDIWKAMPSPLQEIGAYLENEINRLGYAHLRSSELDSAIVMFRYNTESFPKSPNGYDSLGEAWLAKGDTAQAVQYYKRALELNPAFVNAANVLEQLSEFGWH